MQRIHDEAVEAAREYWKKAGRTRRGQGGREIECVSGFACFEQLHPVRWIHSSILTC